MKKITQIGYILGILLVSELIEKIFNLPLPGAILGMIILTILLMTNILKLKDIEEGANTLIGLLAFFFVPILVGAKDSLGLLEGKWVEVLILLIVPTLVVMVITAYVVQNLNRYMDKKEGENGNK